jgi:hypothetical protein
MWIDRQNTQLKIFLGIMVAIILYNGSFYSKFDNSQLPKLILYNIIAIIVLGIIINWLVRNGYKIIAWIIALLPLVFIPTFSSITCATCYKINRPLIDESSINTLK